jgi:acetoacetyl-CoA synthetase
VLLMHLKEHLLHCDVKPGDRVFYFTTCGWMMWNWLVSGSPPERRCSCTTARPSSGAATSSSTTRRRGHDPLRDVREVHRRVAKVKVEPMHSHKLPELRALLSTGSPLAPEGFDYVYQKVKKDICLSSISGGTDLVACFVGGCPILPVWRGELQCRLLGMKVEVFDDDGRSLRGEKGELVCTAPFPTMPLGFWNDPDGASTTPAYYERFPNVWRHGDWCEITPHDGMIIYGRSDAVLNPGGVRIGTAEIYRRWRSWTRWWSRSSSARTGRATCGSCSSCGCATASRSTSRW